MVFSPPGLCRIAMQDPNPCLRIIGRLVASQGDGIAPTAGESPGRPGAAVEVGLEASQKLMKTYENESGEFMKNLES